VFKVDTASRETRSDDCFLTAAARETCNRINEQLALKGASALFTFRDGKRGIQDAAEHLLDSLNGTF
jgi:hypothetical protein